MAKKSQTKPTTNRLTKSFAKGIDGINGLLNQLSTSLYGTDMGDESDRLNDRFNAIMDQEINQLTGNGSNDYSTFLGKLYNTDKASLNTMRELTTRLQNGASETALSPRDFIDEQYQNRMIRQADAHEISNQLIELREARDVMRDAILSADKNSGRIQRQIIFDKTTVNDASEDYTPAVEAMEKKFDLQKKIKDFIVTNCLDYGEYYVYTIPYHELFKQFSDKYRSGKNGTRTFFESVDPEVETITEEPLFESGDSTFMKKLSSNIMDVLDVGKGTSEYEKTEKSVGLDVSALGDRITVSTSHVPIPILENGLDALQGFRSEYITESGELITEAAGRKQKSVKKKDDKIDTSFLNKYGSRDYEPDGFNDERSSKGETFDDVRDCYMKLIEPTRLFPVKVMDEVLFYIYVQTDEAVPLTTILSYTSSFKAKDPSNRVNALLDDITDRIVSKFDKTFVKQNKDFRKLIVAALEYHELGNKKIHFQVIPKEYITPFKINCDVNGNGTSMLDPSLFYAKLYLMLLMFKIVSIVTNSNDQKINYLRTSGIDKNVFNKAQEIARQKQARRITLNDMFSYTGVLNKVAAGSEIYMPLGTNGERPIETEILQGQEVQLNTDLMEQLRTSYILGTGVPSAIMNYLNEADFAKSIETANTKMTGRVMSYQIDFNAGLTELYQKLLRYTTNIPEEVISTVSIVLPEPKGNSNITQRDNIDNYTSLQDFLVKIYFGDDADDDKHVKRFIKGLAKLHLPMINFAEIDNLYDESKLEAVEDKTRPPEPDAEYDEE